MPVEEYGEIFLGSHSSELVGKRVRKIREKNQHKSRRARVELRHKHKEAVSKRKQTSVLLH